MSKKKTITLDFEINSRVKHKKTGLEGHVFSIRVEKCDFYYLVYVVQLDNGGIINAHSIELSAL